MHKSCPNEPAPKPIQPNRQVIDINFNLNLCPDLLNNQPGRRFFEDLLKIAFSQSIGDEFMAQTKEQLQRIVDAQTLEREEIAGIAAHVKSTSDATLAELASLRDQVAALREQLANPEASDEIIALVDSIVEREQSTSDLLSGIVPTPTPEPAPPVDPNAETGEFN